MRFFFCLIFVITAACGTDPAIMRWDDLTSRPMPQPDATLRYGDHESATADLWLPEDVGPHPVVLMIHGGCWQKEIADKTLMNWAAADLSQRGMAVWNVEYRGVDEEGGGYPGTYLDVAAAAALLLEEGESLGLDTSRIAGFGHSAGGHLIAWLAQRHRIPPDSALAALAPFPLSGAVLSGALADLEAAAPVTLPDCLAEIAPALQGEGRADPYADISAARLLPADTRLISVHGTSDRIAPPALGTGFTGKAGPLGAYVEIGGEGHVELIAPGSAAFAAQAAALTVLLTPLPAARDR